MTPADHPDSCRMCDGTGWMPGPPIPSVQHGRIFTYSTVTPCTHHWDNDEPELPLEVS